MVPVEITLRETYRKLAGFYPPAGRQLPAAGEALIYRPGNFEAMVSGTGFFGGCKEDHPWTISQHKTFRILSSIRLGKTSLSSPFTC
jgi:hypothetical protein